METNIILMLRHEKPVTFQVFYCPNCKRELPQDMYCRNCHAAVKQMISKVKEEHNESLALA